MNDSDVILINVKFYDESGKGYSWDGYNIAKCFDNNIDFNDFVFNYTHIREHLLNKYFSACAKMYKTEFLRSYDDFYFPKHVFYEDVPFHVQILLRASRISFCTDELYVYRVSNNDSIMNTSSKGKRVFDIFTVVNEVEKILNEYKKMDEFRQEFSVFKIRQLTQWFDKCDKSIKKEFFELTKQNFEEMGMKAGEIANLDDYFRDEYQNIINSDSYREVELLKKINQLGIVHADELRSQRMAYEENFEVQRQAYEENFEIQREAYKNLEVKKQACEKNLEIQRRINQEIMSSNSWKLTKSFRKIGSWLKNLN